ncbi:MAG TPA: hypothetical protein ENH74_11160 [Methylophaga sp.]|nr:hypothetical protein [Methylophaga sp.]
MNLDLIRDPIPQLLRKIAIPASVGMFFNTMYYVVDNFYAGMLSSTALAGISLAAPIYFMGLAISIGVGQGTSALVGNSLGAARQQEAEQIAGSALSFAWVCALAMGLLVHDIDDLVGKRLPTLPLMSIGMRIFYR